MELLNRDLVEVVVVGGLDGICARPLRGQSQERGDERAEREHAGRDFAPIERQLRNRQNLV